MIIVDDNKVEIMDSDIANHPLVSPFWKRLLAKFTPGHPIWKAIGNDEEGVSEVLLLTIQDAIEAFSSRVSEHVVRDSIKEGFTHGAEAQSKIDDIKKEILNQ